MVFKYRYLAVLCLLGFFLFPVISYAQLSRASKKSQALFQEALDEYRSGELNTAKNKLKQSIQKDSLNVQAFLLLSDIYEDMGEDSLQIETLTGLVGLDAATQRIVSKKLAGLYMKEYKFKQALDYWEQLLVFENSEEIKLKISDCEYLVNINEIAKEAIITNPGDAINTSANEYWPFISADDSTLFFTRLIRHNDVISAEHIYFSERDDSTWLPAQELQIDIDNLVNVGTLSITANNDLIFFTACGMKTGKGSCDIFYFIKEKGKWRGPINAGDAINSGLWESQPSVSANGDKLFFVSNKQGSLGKKDIWVSDIIYSATDGLQFSSPVNLGRGVNTKEDDFSPFIHADGKTLYYASNGPIGFGKSDIFVSVLKDSIWGRGRNLGMPINSSFDDNGLVVSPTGLSACFSSNRANTSDIYLLKLPKAFMPDKAGYIKGMVYDSESKLPLDAKIKLVNLANNKEVDIESFKDMGYVTTITANTSYLFNVSKPGYLFYSEHVKLVDPEEFKSATTLNIYLNPIKINSRIVLNNVFFDFDSFYLKQSSYPELNEVIQFLKQNSSLKVEIAGHTDNIGSENYNLELSDKRAREVANYLEKEVGEGRIFVKGYGDKEPVDSNDTEIGRANNRRTELRIIGN